MTQINKEGIKHGTKELNIAIYDHNSLNADYSFNSHWHPEYEIEYIYDGPLDFILDGVLHTVNSGDILFINPKVIHSCTVPSGYQGRYTSIVFGDQFVFSNYNDYLYRTYLIPLYEKNMYFPTRLPENTECRSIILEHIRCLINCYFEKKFAYEINMRSHLLCVFYTAVNEHIFTKEVRIENSATLLARSAMLLIQGNYTSTLTVGSIAAQMNITPEYLCRIFKSAVGKTPLEFILTCRIECAQMLLTESDATISSVAALCGFDDFNYFSRYFKKVQGVTPSVYRAKYRNNESNTGKRYQRYRRGGEEFI